MAEERERVRRQLALDTKRRQRLFVNRAERAATAEQDLVRAAPRGDVTTIHLSIHTAARGSLVYQSLRPAPLRPAPNHQRTAPRWPASRPQLDMS